MAIKILINVFVFIIVFLLIVDVIVPLWKGEKPFDMIKNWFKTKPPIKE